MTQKNMKLSSFKVKQRDLLLQENFCYHSQAKCLPQKQKVFLSDLSSFREKPWKPFQRLEECFHGTIGFVQKKNAGSFVGFFLGTRIFELVRDILQDSIYVACCSADAILTI